MQWRVVAVCALLACIGRQGAPPLAPNTACYPLPALAPSLSGPLDLTSYPPVLLYCNISCTCRTPSTRCSSRSARLATLAKTAAAPASSARPTGWHRSSTCVLSWRQPKRAQRAAPRTAVRLLSGWGWGLGAGRRRWAGQGMGGGPADSCRGTAHRRRYLAPAPLNTRPTPPSSPLPPRTPAPPSPLLARSQPQRRRVPLLNHAPAGS